MPRIKAYKQADKLIPVNSARVVTAFQCPWTKKLWTSKKRYIQHLQKLRETRIHSRIVHNRLKKAQIDLNNQNSFGDIIEWIERNSWFFLAKAKQSNVWSKEKWPAPEDFWIRITYLDIRHSNNVSNTHSAPKGKASNWGRRDPNLPTGYPGWEGRIEYQMSHSLPGFSSDLLRGTGIYTGSGGGTSNNRYGYSVIFWDEDWPGMMDQTVFNILANKRFEPFKYGRPNYFR
jgi:uncharacterized C2H2 Zn-finger protein